MKNRILTNKKNQSLIIGLVLVLIFVHIFFRIWRNAVSEEYLPIEQGRVDISEWYQNEKKIVPLKGTWDFYWNRFVTAADLEQGAEPDLSIDVPKVWNHYNINGETLPGFGYATYHLKVTGVQKGKEIALWIPTISAAYRCYIDDEQVASVGNVSTGKKGSEAGYEPLQITYTPTGDSFDIMIQVSNYLYSRGGMWYTPYLGAPSQLLAIREGILSRDLFLLGCFLVMVFIYGSMFFFRKQAAENRYFSILCFITACRTLLHGSYFINVLIPNISVDMIVRLDYLTLAWLPVMMGQMLKELYLKDISVNMHKVFRFYAFGMTAFVVCTPVSFFTKFIYLAEFMILFISAYLIWKMLYIVKTKKEDALLIFLGSIVLMAAGIYDILFENSLIAGKLVELTPMGFFVMLLAQAYVLAKHFTDTIQKKDKAIAELQISMEREHKAELKFLKSQIRPHFIYNALNAIISISRKDVYRSQELLVEFSTYLRGCFDFKDLENLVPLKRELELIEAYIILEQARFGESLRVVYEIEDINIMIPPLILQPLAENAVNHGIRPKQGGGTIRIYVKLQEQNTVRIGIMDDGTGITPERIDLLISGKEDSRGIGIFNITTRLQKLYGTHLCIVNRPEGGLDVYMNLPYTGGNVNDTSNTG